MPLTIRVPSISKPNIQAPNVRAPTVQTPTVRTPTVRTPTVNTPTVRTPTINTPNVRAPTVRTPTLPTAPTVQKPGVPQVRTPNMPQVRTPNMPQAPNVRVPNMPNVPNAHQTLANVTPTIEYYDPVTGQTTTGSQQNTTNNTVVVVNNNKGPGLLVRAIWFIFIGWWLGFWWMAIGWWLCFSIIGLPIGLMMLNRLPGVMTLKPRKFHTTVNISNSNYGNSSVQVQTGGSLQVNFFIRAVYFLVFGWWVGAFYSVIAYFMCLLIFTLPAGILMLNYLPAVLTLRRNQDSVEVNSGQTREMTLTEYAQVLDNAKTETRLMMLSFAWALLPARQSLKISA